MKLSMRTHLRPVAVMAGPNSGQIFENLVDKDFRFDRLISPKKAAELLDVSEKFIYECIARKEIHAERVGNRLRRIRLSVLEAWLRRK